MTHPALVDHPPAAPDDIAAWAFTHRPTHEAYRRCTGEDIGAALDRYRAWLEENITGPPS